MTLDERTKDENKVRPRRTVSLEDQIRKNINEGYVLPNYGRLWGVYIYGTFPLFTVSVMRFNYYIYLSLGSLTSPQTELTRMKEIPPMKLAGFASQLERRVPYTYIHKMPAVIVERTRLLIRYSTVTAYVGRTVRIVLLYTATAPIDTDRYHSTREKWLARERKTNSQLMAGVCPSG